MRRVRRLKFILWFILGLATAVAVMRFLFGLGVTTNLSDATPWGVWIGFDVMSGVALAAGGFLVTAAVYIFKLEQFHELVRPAVLTAFLGYVAVAVGLLFDLGLPWNIWHMLIYWNPRSPLFEVGWCVMLYLTVLALEFFPVPAEEFSALARIRRALLKIRLPLVITGIGLSTLHQSSLGSLFLLMPYHLHPLWSSPILPVLFFVSAVGLGLMMVIFESHTTAWLYHRKPETALLARFGAGARWVLLGYLGLRLADPAWRGQLHHLLLPQWQTAMFWFELALMAALPAALLFVPRARQSRQGQWAIASLGVSGVVLNRVNVGGLVHEGRGAYFPSWTELAITAGVVSCAVLVFLYIVERFRVWEQRPADPEAAPETLPEFDRVGMTWLGVPIVASRTLYSLAFIVAASIGFALLNPAAAAGRGVAPAPVHHARGGEVLWIDGNLDGYGVAFPHKLHQVSKRETIRCADCHHLNLPLDETSGCYHCHQDMYQATDAFRHDWHASPAGAALACRECHAEGRDRSAATAKPCTSCHHDLIPPGATIQVRQWQALGYVHAMHRMCIGCHARRAERTGEHAVAQCAACHRADRAPAAARTLLGRGRPAGSKQIVLPPY
jgi:Ni/Fe-hydrogenase subunit HybB-like protein